MSVSDAQIGFRVGKALAARIALAEAEPAARAVLVRQALARGLASFAEGPVNISPDAREAGAMQLRVQLGGLEAERLEDLRRRAQTAEGKQVSRVVILRECVLRGLDSLAKPP